MKQYEVALGNSNKLKVLPSQRTETAEATCPRVALNKVLKKWRPSIKVSGYFVVEITRVR